MQAAHAVVPPALSEYAPAWHAIQAVAAGAAAAAPAPHVVQAVAAGKLEYAPRGQLVQADAPESRLLYVPARHAVQTPGSDAPMMPLYVPAMQTVHPVLPETLLYAPAAHAVQPPAPAGTAEYDPGLQAVQEDAPAGRAV